MGLKNDIITLTRSELKAMIENAVTEKLLQLNSKYPDLFEDYSFSSDDGSEDYGSEDYGSDDYGSDDSSETYFGEGEYKELDKLIDLYQSGSLAEPEDDYSIEYTIRHYKRGRCDDSELEDLLNQLRELYNKSHTNKSVNKHNIVKKLTTLINIFEEDYENEEDQDYGISYDIRHYKRGDREFRSYEAKLQLYNNLKKRIMEEV